MNKLDSLLANLHRRDWSSVDLTLQTGRGFRCYPPDAYKMSTFRMDIHERTNAETGEAEVEVTLPRQAMFSDRCVISTLLDLVEGDGLRVLFALDQLKL